MLFEIILLIAAIPVGFLIAYLANDELVQGRKWFRAIILLSLLAIAASATATNIPILLTSIFALIVATISYWKSFDKLWTKRRI